MAPLHRELAAILRKHLGAKPRLPAPVAAAIEEVSERWLAGPIAGEASLPARPSVDAALAQTLLESAQDCIVLVSPCGGMLAHNERFASLWNLPPDVIEAGDFNRVLPNILFELRHPEVLERVMAVVTDDPTTVRTEVLEFIDGRYFELHTQPQRTPDGSVARAWSFRNVSQIKRAEEAYRHDAFHDALTGLPNRALFADRLGQALAQAGRTETQVAIMFMDLDKFKNVNDTLGHGAGDELLQSVSSRLQARVRSQDTLSRLAGDEFMILINGLPSAEAACHVAQSILDTMSLPFRIEDQALQVGASIGISLFPGHGDDAEELMKRADVALYQAKEEGRNRYKLFKPGMTNPSTDKMVFENDLRSAVVQDELVLHYQPIVDARQGRVFATEALVRWQRGTTLIPPSRFIPIAESSGLIGPISEWVLRTATQASREWSKALGRTLAVSVNFSAQQFWDPNLVIKIQQQLEAVELDPRALIVEITESTIMQDPANGLGTLKKLRALGISVALDDFGTGHSSLSVLRQLPINALKIDRSFVSQCDADPRDGAIVAAIIAMAKSLRLRVVAEGVERKSQAQFLRQHECDAIQGFWFSKPLPAPQLEAVLRIKAAKQASKGSSRGRRPVPSMGTTAPEALP